MRPNLHRPRSLTLQRPGLGGGVPLQAVQRVHCQARIQIHLVQLQRPAVLVALQRCLGQGLGGGVGGAGQAARQVA